jgi:hypothetical protein
MMFYLRARKHKENAWIYVESEAVLAVRYAVEKGDLDVQFTESRESRYHTVPRSKFRALLAANSIGLRKSTNQVEPSI